MAQLAGAEVSLEAAHKNRDALLAHLQTKGIPFERFDHVAVHTVEEQVSVYPRCLGQTELERLLGQLVLTHLVGSCSDSEPTTGWWSQAKHVSDANGALSKNLLLKDKKGRLLMVTALTATKIDLKALSARLGVGKGGLRMAPPEALALVLQVPPGSCSPLALWQPSARQVGLLLDKGFETHAKLLCHPLTNDASLALSPQAVRDFLESIDRRAHFVDLEAEPSVGKDQPPDLADCLAELATPKPTDSLEEKPPSSEQHPPHPPAIAPPTRPPTAEPAAAVRTESKSLKSAPPPDSVELCSRRLVEKMVKALPAEVAATLSKEWKKQTAMALQQPLVMFKNAAYAHGWAAHQVRPN